MGCIAALIALITPRLIMVLIWLFSDWFIRAYESSLWPLLGFLFMPYTTLAYMAAMLHNDHRISGIWVALLVIAVIVDLSADGGCVQVKSKRRKPETPAENEPRIIV